MHQAPAGSLMILILVGGWWLVVGEVGGWWLMVGGYWGSAVVCWGWVVSVVSCWSSVIDYGLWVDGCWSWSWVVGSTWVIVIGYPSLATTSHWYLVIVQNVKPPSNDSGSGYLSSGSKIFSRNLSIDLQSYNMHAIFGFLPAKKTHHAIEIEKHIEWLNLMSRTSLSDVDEYHCQTHQTWQFM